MSGTERDQDLYRRLDELDLDHDTISHAPVFTVEEAQAIREGQVGAHIKNLFLRDKKKNLFLVTALETSQVDLKQLRHLIGASGNLSFGNADLLMEVLGVIPGSVSPLCVFNDQERRVHVVLDKGILDHETVHAHPLRNDKTTAIGTQDLLAFLKAEGYEPQILDFAAAALEAQAQ
ncbi:prolyl-tRNA synthetase associated domain-containing protein [Aestuariispira insulae]|uniref:Ala-tRNA(Pro) hydrolase n=1 Tax=Aestuariispira insulae TaxID=1461337 RepID=A0A3D9HPW0_9PROT|nr:prolyl-tRNA synthetase associated domain-containing protein [Aestuariispira insulae]RED51527.1 Ala-tRNA(Pro) hydrolase [Aestuariispira insulae]